MCALLISVNNDFDKIYKTLSISIFSIKYIKRFKKISIKRSVKIAQDIH